MNAKDILIELNKPHEAFDIEQEKIVANSVDTNIKYDGPFYTQENCDCSNCEDAKAMEVPINTYYLIGSNGQYITYDDKLTVVDDNKEDTVVFSGSTNPTPKYEYTPTPPPKKPKKKPAVEEPKSADVGTFVKLMKAAQDKDASIASEGWEYNSADKSHTYIVTAYKWGKKITCSKTVGFRAAMEYGNDIYEKKQNIARTTVLNNIQKLIDRAVTNE